MPAWCSSGVHGSREARYTRARARRVQRVSGKHKDSESRGTGVTHAGRLLGTLCATTSSRSIRKWSSHRGPARQVAACGNALRGESGCPPTTHAPSEEGRGLPDTASRQSARRKFCRGRTPERAVRAGSSDFATTRPTHERWADRTQRHGWMEIWKHVFMQFDAAPTARHAAAGALEPTGRGRARVRR